MAQLSLHSPFGDLTVSEWDGKIVSLDWGWGMEQNETPLLLKAKQQLQLYFDGTLKTFDLPLAPAGTLFQQKLWAALEDIPYGQVTSYGALSDKLNSAPRAVGGACGANPIPIIIPCHRVLAKNGGMGGYSGDGGTDTKQQLLKLEGAL